MANVDLLVYVDLKNNWLVEFSDLKYIVEQQGPPKEGDTHTSSTTFSNVVIIDHLLSLYMKTNDASLGNGGILRNRSIKVVDP